MYNKFYIISSNSISLAKNYFTNENICMKCCSWFVPLNLPMAYVKFWPTFSFYFVSATVVVSLAIRELIYLDDIVLIL